MTPTRLLWIFLAAAALGCSGCASSSPQDARIDDEVSQLPWSRPESWEGQGMLGGMVPPGN